MNKLTLLLVLSIFSAHSLVAQDYDKIAASLRDNNDRGIPVVKEFNDDFITNLDKRGVPTVYTKQNSNNFEYIGMPICGIATGQLYMGGDGQLWFWDIFNLTKQMGDYKGEEAYQYPYERSDKMAKGITNIDQGFEIRVGDKVWKLNRDGFSDIAFRGEYPVAKVNFKDDKCPVEVDLAAYSPFIPLELENSDYPATIFNYTIKNISDKVITADISGWLENSALIKSRIVAPNVRLVNNPISLPHAKGISYKAECKDINLTSFSDYGDMTLMVLDNNAMINTNCAYRHFENKNNTTVGGKYKELKGSVVSSVTLQPNESNTVSYVMSWYFPNCRVAGGGKRSYVNRFKDAAEVAEVVTDNFDYLTSTTELWNKTWYDSTLPYWFLDRTFFNTSILASQTCYIFDDGRFYGFEGGLQGAGTCTHVWGYEHAMARLFPVLEQNLREMTDFVPFPKGGYYPESGKINFRGKYNRKAAVDGHSSIIVRSYLTHMMMKDDSFLKKNYKDIKNAMNYLINTNDDNHDGILTGHQHNTLDSDWTGKVAWLSGYYQTALRACAKMSEEMGDKSYASMCLKIANNGQKILEKDLFNGEYFFQLPETDGTKTVGIQKGCEYSQMLGQSQAYQIGLGATFDKEKISKGLNALWINNFTTDVAPYREANKSGRWYAMPGEGGLVACTWPNGGSEALENDNPRFAAYNHECQNGYEYAATSLMMWHDQPYRALAHTWYMDQNRYIGSKRNPYCEIEWGLHYARSMASYGLFTAACGFDYHGPKGEISFSPKIQQQNFKAPFVTAEGWGTYSQKSSANGSEYRLTLSHGSLDLSKITLPILGKKSKVTCSLNGDNLDVKTSWDGKNFTINLNNVVLKTGNEIIISY